MINPLNEVPGNRIHGHSLGSVVAGEEQTVIPGTHSYHPIRQPVNAPHSNLAQRDSGFAKFLKQHSSPTHQRVTAGGRIVPMVKPPPFVLPISGQPLHDLNGYYAPRVQDERDQKAATMRVRHGTSLEAFASSAGDGSMTSSIMHNATDGSEEKCGFDGQQNGGSHRSFTMPNMLMPCSAAPGGYYPALFPSADPFGHAQFNLFTPGYPTPHNFTFVPHSDLDNGPTLTSADNEQHGQQNSDTRQFAPTFGPSVYHGQTTYAPYTHNAVVPHCGPYQQAPWPWISPPLLHSGPNMSQVIHRDIPMMAAATEPPGAFKQPYKQSQKPATYRGQKSLHDRIRTARYGFERYSKHLEELNAYMARYGDRLNKKVYEEKVEERKKYQANRNEAYQQWKSLCKLEEASRANNTLNPPPTSAGNVPASLDGIFNQPSINVKDSPGRKTLNVRAAPWTPRETGFSLQSSSEDQAPQESSGDSGNSMADFGAANQSSTDDHDHDSIVIKTTDETSLGSCAQPRQREKKPNAQGKDSNHTEQQMSAMKAGSKALMRDGYLSTAANGNRAVVLASSSEEHQEMPVSPSRWAETNHEKVLDALRLPPGCVTKVEIIGGTETMVHGQGLRQPPWETLGEHQKEYWTRKPDHVFFGIADDMGLPARTVGKAHVASVSVPLNPAYGPGQLRQAMITPNEYEAKAIAHQEKYGIHLSSTNDGANYYPEMRILYRCSVQPVRRPVLAIIQTILTNY